MKYFFLSDGWTIGRVWELSGLWNENIWRRKPDIQRMSLGILEQNEKLWLYQVEDAVLMVEVKPMETTPVSGDIQAIGQVVLKRLIGPEQAIEKLSTAEQVFQGASSSLTIQ
ncbi:MAG: hypothetical protein SFW36_18155 [Leptolyngbyaceae cyanobacterium bins.59]|nr:hypothetical protein [Leptolyngbyaceae cyanobacterium bins.59]